jgi:hypothetical protein
MNPHPSLTPVQCQSGCESEWFKQLAVAEFLMLKNFLQLIFIALCRQCMGINVFM